MIRNRSVRLITFVLLGLIIAAVPVLVGCGDNEPAENVVITIGSLADFSGAAAYAVIPTVDSAEEAISFYMDKDPIKGVTLDFVHYDHQLNYSKTVEGYQDLKSRGMDILYAMGPTERDMLTTYLEDDHMPCIGSSGRVDTLGFPWIWNVAPTMMWGGEQMMQWIADTWDYSKGTPKVGHQGWVLNTSAQVQSGIDYVLSHPDFAGKFNFVGSDIATMTNAAWSTSYEKFKDCDYVVVSMIGNGAATFVNQMRSLGYKGALVSTTDSFTGYWGLVQSKTPADQLTECYYIWWGPLAGSDSDADWYQDMVETCTANHADAATRLATTGSLSGWLTGRLIYEGIKGAAKEVGPENIDGDALQAGLNAVEIEYEEIGSTFKFSESNHTGLTDVQVAKWNVTASRWEILTGKWYQPLSLAD